MSNDAPMGAEREAVIQLREIVERIDRSLCEDRIFPSITFTSITVDHALEGVRVNGRKELINVMTVLGRLREYVKNMLSFRRYVMRIGREATAGLLAAEKILKDFKVCSECGGKSGKCNPPVAGLVKENWVPCVHCGARGIVEA